MRVLIVLGSREFEETWTHVVVSEVDDVEVRACSTHAIDHVLQTFAPALVIAPDELHGTGAEQIRGRGFLVVEVRRDEGYADARARVEEALRSVRQVASVGPDPC